MNDFPDVLGKELHDATALLEAEGLDFIIVETKPAKKELTEGVLRVIKVQPQVGKTDQAANQQSQCNNFNRSLVLTVCRI